VGFFATMHVLYQLQWSKHVTAMANVRVLLAEFPIIRCNLRKIFLKYFLYIVLVQQRAILSSLLSSMCVWLVQDHYKVYKCGQLYKR